MSNRAIRLAHIDDSEEDLELTRIHLSKISREMEIHGFLDAREALDTLRKEEFDCVLCDYQMPEMNGAELIEALRKENNDIPFIFLTGQGNEALAIQALREGAADYFTKDEGFAHYERLLNSIKRSIDQSEIEKNLVRSETRYRTLFEQFNEAIFIFSREHGTILDCNSSALKLSGREFSDLIGSPSTVLVTEDASDGGMASFISEAMNADGQYSTFAHLVDAKGNTREVFIVMDRFDLDGTPCLRAIVEDETVRRSLQRALNLHRQLLDSIDVAAIYTDAEGKIRYVNQFAEKLFGWKAGAVIGQHILDTTVIPDKIDDAESILDQLRKGKTWSGSYVLKRSDGTAFPAYVVDSPVFDGEGNLTGIIGISYDMTEQQNSTIALRFRIAIMESLSTLIEMNPHATMITGVCRLILRILEKSGVLQWSALLVPRDVNQRQYVLMHGDCRDQTCKISASGCGVLAETVASATVEVFDPIMKKKLGVLSDYCPEEGKLVAVPLGPGSAEVGVLLISIKNEYAIQEEEVTLLQSLGRIIAEKINAVVHVQDGGIRNIRPQPPLAVAGYLSTEIIRSDSGEVVDIVCENMDRHAAHILDLEGKKTEGVSLDKLLLDAEFSEILSLSRQVVDKGKARSQTVHIRRNEVRGWYDFHAEPKGDDELLFSIVDITRHEQARQQLTESEARYRSATEASLDAYYLLRAIFDERGEVIDFEIVDVNTRAIHELGMNREDLIGQRICELFPINRTGGFFEKYKRVFTSGTPIEEDYHIPTESTAPGWYYHQVAPTTDGVVIVNRNITDRVNTETRIKENEERLMLAMNAADIDTWELDYENGIVIRSPRRIIEKLDYDPDVFPSDLEAQFALTHPDDLPHIKKSLEDHNSGLSDLIDIQHRIRNASGEYVWLHTIGKILDRPEGGSRFVGIAMNIHERKMEQERYRLLVQLQAEGIISADADLNISFCNAAAASIFGMSDTKDIIDTNLLEHMSSHAGGQFTKELQALEPGGLAALETSITRPDGEQRLLEMQVRRLDQNIRAFPRYFATFHDATVIRETQRAIVESNSLLTTVLNTIPVPVFYKTTDGKYRDCNSTFAEQILGSSVAAVYGTPIHEYIDILGKEFVSTVKAKDQELFLKGDIQQYNHELNCADGHIREFSFIKAPVFNATGTITGLVGVMMDITSLREHEKRLLSYQNELEAINAELKAFAYTVSHDLQAPLRHISAFTRLLKESVQEEEGKELVQRILGAAGRMQSFVEDILKLSRVTNLPVQRTECDLSAMATVLGKEFKESENTKNAELTIQSGLNACCDEGLVKIALQNLLSNAFKFSQEEEEPKITFGKDIHDNRNTFFVRDNGVGIPEDQAGNVFTPFIRLHSSKRFEGSGIGLTTVKRIISMHGGKIWLQSTEGKGTTVYFTLDTDGDDE